MFHDVFPLDKRQAGHAEARAGFGFDVDSAELVYGQYSDSLQAAVNIDFDFLANGRFLHVVLQVSD